MDFNPTTSNGWISVKFRLLQIHGSSERKGVGFIIGGLMKREGVFM